MQKNKIIDLLYELLSQKKYVPTHDQIDLCHELWGNFKYIKLYQLLKYFPMLKKLPKVKNIYIYGRVGVGKSLIMNILLQYLEQKNIYVKRYHFHDFMLMIHAELFRLRNNQKHNDEDRIKIIARNLKSQAQILCLDEVMISDITDATLVGRLFSIFNKYGIISVMTSNSKPSMLYKNGINRQLFLPFILLLQKSARTFCLKGHFDHRKENVIKSNNIFYPLNKKTEQQFFYLLKSKCQDLQDLQEKINSQKVKISNKSYKSKLLNYFKPVSIRVLNREVVFQHYYNKILYTDFNEICNRLINQGEYKELLNKADIFFIDNIPNLQGENEMAIRYRNLIDYLYEGNKKLIQRQACDIELLFGDDNQAFLRTISRLYELTEGDQ